MRDIVVKNFQESAQLIQQVGNQYADQIVEISKVIIRAYQKGNKVITAGNGGSATDAQHLAGELVAKFYKERKALPAICLSTDTAVITAWSNDVSYDTIFKRQLEAHGNKGDIFIALTTSGNSANVIHAVEKAKELGVITIGLLGRDGGKLKGQCNHELIVPGNDVARIQEAQKVIFHTLCQLIEQAFVK